MKKNENDAVRGAAQIMSSLGAASGGKARAKKLDGETRKEIAKKASRARWDNYDPETAKLPRAQFTGEIVIGTATIPCAVLDDGTRLLTQEGFLKALGRAGKAKGGQGASVDNVPAFMAANNLKPFISIELMESTKAVVFRTASGVKAYGYNADVLPKVCVVFVDADKAKKIVNSQRHIADQAYMLLKGLAEVGIAALIDEATGYQDVRDRQALQKILEKYLTDEYSKWTKRFPDSFYKELFRLKGLTFPPSASGQKPSYVGHWTNDIVYSRLAPGVLKQLKELSPRKSSGSRERKFHQYLTDEYGIPELKQHLYAVEILMKSCKTWEEFKIRLDSVLTKYGDSIPMDI